MALETEYLSIYFMQMAHLCNLGTRTDIILGDKALLRRVSRVLPAKSKLKSLFLEYLFWCLLRLWNREVCI